MWLINIIQNYNSIQENLNEVRGIPTADSQTFFQMQIIFKTTVTIWHFLHKVKTKQGNLAPLIVPHHRVWFILSTNVKLCVYRPAQALMAPGGWGSLNFNSQRMKVARFSAPHTHCTPPSPQGNIPGMHLCLRLSGPQGHSAAGKIKLKKMWPQLEFIYYLSGCSELPQPTTIIQSNRTNPLCSYQTLWCLVQHWWKKNENLFKEWRWWSLSWLLHCFQGLLHLYIQDQVLQELLEPEHGVMILWSVCISLLVHTV